MMSNTEIIVSQSDSIDENIDSIEETKQLSIDYRIPDLNPFEDKSFIIDLVNKMDDKLKFVSKEGKSEVWNRYQRIFYMNIETNFVKCIFCNDIKTQVII